MNVHCANNFINVISLLCMLLFSSILKAEEFCEMLSGIVDGTLKKSPISAEYTYTVADTENKIQQERTLTLWRRENQVVIQTTKYHPSELWELTKNNQLRVTRFFENEQRGIEYQPDEIKIGQEKNDWSFKYQLISDTLINRMTPINPALNNKNKLNDCGDIQHLFLNEKNTEIELSWLPKIKLMVSLQVKEPHVSTQWQLQKIMSDEEVIDQYFSQLMSFQTTDYADIGDNESDPFFIKMINMGFVEHASSGFYDSSGHNLTDEKSHRH